MSRQPARRGEQCFHNLLGARLLARTKAGEAMVVAVDGVLAEGGVGVVYSGRRLDGFGPVAVKLLKPSHARDEELRRRFAREVRCGMRVVHERVVRVEAFGETGEGVPFYVMRRLDGETLGAAVRRRGPFPIGEAIAVTSAVLDGLAAIHDAGLVHCDIQPENVFLELSSMTRAASPTILDFGFALDVGARRAGRPDDHDTLAGTPSFMSPEQALRRRVIGYASDLFSLGAVLYYVVSGRLPFSGHVPRDALVSIIRSAPIPLRRRLRGVPRGLEAVLSRAFAKHPEARFATALEMRTALDHVAGSVRASEAVRRGFSV